ncbi:hypothetical protein PPSIR1_30035 [Plesiocystis pacifica SIR-1]|uniref:Lipoprotein n=1 Tax=Plesiocystis pacifica SIR-1 TaxID=391625 RepID=A6FYY6_9BACT|nr:hypothetical protein [Plesiocystis pacifica]EDM81141.1 hypothetical protein PPSIR1_30035 [Plesiocystis pacifica SIR-1]
MTTKTRLSSVAGFALASLASLALLGCDVGTKPVGTDEAGDDDTGGTETTGSDDTSSSDTTDATDGESTGTDDEQASEGQEDDWNTMCESWCQVLDTCLSEDDPACLDDCVQAFTDIAEQFPSCLSVNEDYFTCIGALSCEDFGGDEPCFEEYAALGECEDPGCETSFGGALGSNECEFSTQCTFGPLYEVECVDGGDCTCLVNGMEVASCFNRGQVCSVDPGGDPSAINSCCGWDLP